MSQIMYPDELVSKLFEEIAYNKGEIKLGQLWDISKTLVNVNDDSMKSFVFALLTSNPDIVLYKNKKEVEKMPFSSLKENEDKISIGISEDKLWLILTGYNKKESTIGNFAFELLLEVAKHKENGINTMLLAKNTKQDSRSTTGRLKKLAHLITTKQLIYQGHLVKQVTLKKFQKEEPEIKEYINMKNHLGTIVNIVKNSKNGIRQTTDLKRELKFDKEKRLSKRFISAITFLDEKGYLQKIMIISPNNPNIKVKCVKYIKDFSEENKANSYLDMNDSSEDDEDAEDGVEDSNNTRQEEEEEEEEINNLDYINPSSILQDKGLIMEDKGQTNRQELLLNRFYPLQNQTYDLAAQTETDGMPTMKATNLLVGKDFQRSFAKGLEYYAQMVGKKKLGSSGLNLVKIYDFEGKKKFYRLFTEENFQKMTDPTKPYVPAKIPPMKVQKLSLDKLNKKNFVLLSNTLRYGVNTAGDEVFFWHGSDTSSLTAKDIKKIPKSKKLKRESKDDLTEADIPKLKKIKQAVVEEALVNNDDNDVTPLVELTRPEEMPITERRTLNVDGFFATSLKSLQRQRTLLDIVSKMGGVAYLKESLYDDLSKALGSNTMVDKKTARSDVDRMVKSGKLLVYHIPDSKKKLIHIPGMTESDLELYMDKEKNKKKYVYSSTLHTSDLYFFDQIAKERFNRREKSVQRLRDFQNRNKSDTLAGDSNKYRRPRKPRASKATEAAGHAKKRRGSLFTAISEDKNSSTRKKKSVVKKLAFHVGKKSGLEALIMAVVITKSISNEIQWDKISLLFPKNSLENLKKKWTTRRVKMGHNGWKAYVDKWQRILVQAIKNEYVSLQDAESVNLPVLIPLWITFEENRKNTSVSLFKDYDTNIKRYTFVKDPPQHFSQAGMMMSSMVQRETSLLKSTYVYSLDNANKDEEQKKDQEDNIKTVIRSILMDRTETGKDEIEILKNVSKEELDRIVLDLAKSKQLILRGPKLEASSLVVEMLENKGPYAQFSEAAEYNKRIENMLSSGNGLIISQEINDIAAWQLIDLIERRNVSLQVIPVERDIGNFHYTTRKFEIETLTPPIICLMENDSKQLFSSSPQVPVPLGAAYSRLWINSNGGLRENIWKHLVAFVTTEILFSPGIMIEQLETLSYHLVSKKELSDICNWLIKKGLIESLPFDGFKATYKWYKLLA
ncbi:similar to Saccharomyces cerevisiae YAL001C TFC3 Largest of six subunits of the RNA polymerase III transcription initiation factor complex (TFIIIC) [Maudiozyma saulgeensis]|uniref:Similar to Saccharomyces cerevisiae YAL001C TFC3 Largest of six subunits of the RNA polymerase III transcription initiation factor complex (TFIIIC) n=1 Tax=Maudiozyma saulgeensis TaxID=1789683 RepID=A0A1X7RAJ6_9SACH|nr:similar to Saccharomyces cerevisiae YAL001C TFC3 Largest of six subunits of the RNA polymerase III transcription initiation factor complex (TFIIIC) [Kazachstania saulgeensis]